MKKDEMDFALFVKATEMIDQGATIDDLLNWIDRVQFYPDSLHLAFRLGAYYAIVTDNLAKSQPGPMTLDKG